MFAHKVRSAVRPGALSALTILLLVAMLALAVGPDKGEAQGQSPSSLEIIAVSGQMPAQWIVFDRQRGTMEHWISHGREYVVRTMDYRADSVRERVLLVQPDRR